MKFKYLLPAALLATALSSQAVPAWPGLLERTLEDGSKVMVRLHGDEYFSYITDEAGYLMDDVNGILKYSMKDNVKMQATPELLKDMRVQAEDTKEVKMMRAGEMQRLAALTTEGRTTFCTTGNVRFLVLLVEYSDIKFNSPTIRQDMDDMLNKEGYDKNGCKGSVRDYYVRNSQGKFTPHFDVSEVITLPKESRYYTGGSRYTNVDELVVTACQLADDKIDFSQYCNVNEGEVDAVLIWYAGYGQADTANTDYIWPHQSTVRSHNLELDGVRISSYCCFNELNGGVHYQKKDGALAAMGTPIHEFGHVMGMPDLYDPNYQVKAVPGDWSIFCSGPYLGDGYVPPMCSGYERWMFNWLEYETIEDGKHYDLEDLNKSGRVLRIPVLTGSGSSYKNEYFLIETRSRVNDWDTYLPGNGMLIWHLNYSRNAWDRNQVNSTLSNTRCNIIAADGSANYYLGNYNQVSRNAAWPGELDYLTPDTDITLNAQYPLAASPTGTSYITNMKYDPETQTGSFDYNVITATPNDVTVMHQPLRNVFENGTPNNELIMSWDPVEGATGYQLNVWRVNSSGRVYYECENQNVGNVTSYQLPSFSTAKMGLEYHATVRVVKEIPSSEVSNEVVFIPKELDDVTGVDSVIGGEVAVIGLQGAILAPEGAEVYNMQGVRCGTTGLTPGMYVVRHGVSVSKVLVK